MVIWFPLATSTLHYFIIRGWQGRLQIYPGRDHREQMSKEEMKRSLKKRTEESESSDKKDR